MKNSITFLVILFSILNCIIPCNAVQVDFFIDYNFITFSTFDSLISQKPANVNLYVEYNPLILIYLNWSKSEVLQKLKNNIASSNIRLFKKEENLPVPSAQKKWFHTMQQETDKKIFSHIGTRYDVVPVSKKESYINILNFKELDVILDTIIQNNIERNLNFKIDLSLLLSNKFNKLLMILDKYRTVQYNFYIHADKRYSATKSQINSFIDLIYSLKTQKKLSQPETRIFDLSYTLFTIKLFSHINDLMLNLFPLTTNVIKKYNVSSMEYNINKKKYITLFDRDNFFTFDSSTGYLKKWFLYPQGVCLINFDSFIEKIYIHNKNNSIPVNINNISYFKFDNGLIFKYDSDSNLDIEKNIILQNKKLMLSYKIKNNYKRTCSVTIVIENKFSPSLFHTLTELKNQFAFYPYNKGFTDQYKSNVDSFVNLNTGYGISWNYYHKIKGVEFFKDFYNYTKKIYYKFILYPYEQKVITISYRKKHVKENIRSAYLKTLKPITNQYFGDYNIQ
ncbi:MAG: hypothetical protein KKH98_03740 [Spirochaetes bacterium]|nr:hypothetical protein [Spirochaetota bacterium]